MAVAWDLIQYATKLIISTATVRIRGSVRVMSKCKDQGLHPVM